MDAHQSPRDFGRDRRAANMPRCDTDAAGDVCLGSKVSKIGPKEQQRRALRERQKRPSQRVKSVSGPKPSSKAPEATPDEITRLLKQRDKRRAKARVYQRGYYKAHREQILQQRKARAEKRT